MDLRVPFVALALVTLTLVAGCPTSHDPGSDGGGGGGVDAPSSAVDAPGGGTDAPSVPECDVPSACVLRPASCCGSCGAATPDDMIALPTGELDAYVTEVCDGAVCPGCAAMTDPYLLATCEAGRCVAVNLHTSPLTECTSASDCVLSPRLCCGCGFLSAGDIVAHNPANGSYGSLVCDPDADCPPCVPEYGSASADCVDGRCVVVP